MMLRTSRFPLPKYFPTSAAQIKTSASLPSTTEEKTKRIRRLLEANEKTELSFTEIAKRCQITNAYCANVFYGRARIDDEIASKLKKAVPTLTEEDIALMKRAPLRTFDANQFQDPTCYRLQEALSQYAEAIKTLVNEDFGDGIMSAVGMYVKVEKVIGAEGEDRVVISFNGKFLPYVIQRTSDIEMMKKAA